MESQIKKVQTLPGLEILCDTIDIRQKITSPEVTENNATIIINIRFPKEVHERLIINKRSSDKSSALYIYVSAKLTGSRCRYIHFKNRYDTTMLFRKFIVEKLKQSVSTWNSHKDAELWCAKHLDDLKTQLESSWEYQLKQLVQLPRKRQKSLIDTNTSVRKARRSSTISIPLHGFVLKGEVPVIRIRQAKKRNRLFLLMSLPGVIFDDDKTRRKSLKTRFGHDNQWVQFVEKYMKSMVNVWETLDDIQKWFFKSNFVNKINQLWEMRQ